VSVLILLLVSVTGYFYNITRGDIEGTAVLDSVNGDASDFQEARLASSNFIPNLIWIVAGVIVGLTWISVGVIYLRNQ